MYLPEELGEEGVIDERSEECEVDAGGEVYHTQAFVDSEVQQTTAH